MMIPIGSYIVGMGWSHQPVADLVLWQAASAGEHLQCCCPQRSNLLTPGVRSHDSRPWRSHVIPLLLLGWWISQHGPFWQHLSCIDCGWNDWAKVQTWQGKEFKGGPMGGAWAMQPLWLQVKTQNQLSSGGVPLLALIAPIWLVHFPIVCCLTSPSTWLWKEGPPFHPLTGPPFLPPTNHH